ncbi:kinetochore CENP-C fungal-like protein [Clohesyomyces aquaticus]|uniref:CENP-C homolog n=1 Tax=Clohesyomyces aquaticus TaxID=1231657 RepID=A0A1Y1ZJZ5_9PLEO|nr:kinetochore CENP-C fungal-like protein [Clohesyomyces aquaticus]
MAPGKKRENQFFDIGVQGRKTGIVLKDRGVRDEHGMEPISGIFSSPAKSPPKRGTARRTGGTVTTSESMDIQESPIPDFTKTLPTGQHLLRSARTKLPPPKSRSPVKTALGSSPRRQSSMGPRSSLHQTVASPDRAASHPAVSRRLDFDQEDSSLQETPALTGSGLQRRGRMRGNIYDIEGSPIATRSAVLEESVMQADISANDTSEMLNGVLEESFDAAVGDGYDESMAGVNGGDASAEVDEPETDPEPRPEVDSEPVKQPVKRVRKRKSDVIDSTAEEAPSSAFRTSKRVATASKTATVQKFKKAEDPVPTKPRGRGRPKRVSEGTQEELSSAMDESVQETEVTEEYNTPIPAKPRGRLPKATTQTQPAPAKEKAESVFKKPKAIAKPKPKPKTSVPSKSESRTGSKSIEPDGPNAGTLVDISGKPLSKAEIERMSTTSTTSRYGRGRALMSIYRELGPDEVKGVSTSRQGRHHLPPVDFWKNERTSYDRLGTLKAIVKNETQEPPPQKRPGAGRAKGKKRALPDIEEEDDDMELSDWEEETGICEGSVRKWDAVMGVPTDKLFGKKLGWSSKGIHPADVADGGFTFTKLDTAPNSFFSWGAIDIPVKGGKRRKNCQRMHMVFFVQTGTVKVTVHENEFTIRKGGLWQVPRGNTYSMTNIGKNQARIFFAQAQQQAPVSDDDEDDEDD